LKYQLTLFLVRWLLLRMLPLCTLGIHVLYFGYCIPECAPSGGLSFYRMYVCSLQNLHICFTSVGVCMCMWMHTVIYILWCCFNPLNAELNPTCHLLALLGAHCILHVSRIRVKLCDSIMVHVDPQCLQIYIVSWTNIYTVL
jgi:hypothetical protein